MSEVLHHYCLWMGAHYGWLASALAAVHATPPCKLASSCPASFVPPVRLPCRAAKALEGALAEIKMDQFPRCPTRAVCGAYIALQVRLG